jgi:hypothetical protein
VSGWYERCTFIWRCTIWNIVGPMPDTMHQKTILHRIKKSHVRHKKCICASSHVQHVPFAYIAKMHRNFSLYSSLALLPLFFCVCTRLFLSFIFQCLWLSITLHACVCVYVVVMQKF